jgi:hypothetical protein
VRPVRGEVCDRLWVNEETLPERIVIHMEGGTRPSQGAALLCMASAGRRRERGGECGLRLAAPAKQRQLADVDDPRHAGGRSEAISDSGVCCS